MALATGIYVIPVLVGGASMPRSSQLPMDLTQLARRHAQFVPDTTFHAAVNKLIEAIEQAQEERKQALEDIAKARAEEERRAEAGRTAEQERLAREKAEAATTQETCIAELLPRLSEAAAQGLPGTRTEIAPSMDADFESVKPADALRPQHSPTTVAFATGVFLICLAVLVWFRTTPPPSHTSQKQSDTSDRSSMLSPSGNIGAVSQERRQIEPALKAIPQPGQEEQKLSQQSLGDVRELHALRDPDKEAGVLSIAFSPDRRTLASGLRNAASEAVRLWDVSNGQLLKMLGGHQSWVDSVAFSRDGRILASGSEDKTIKLWDASSGQLLRTLKLDSGAYVDSIAFSPDGQILAAGKASGPGDTTVDLWDVSSGQLLHALHGHSWTVASVAFSPDGHTLASGSFDKTINIWDTSTAQLLRTLHLRGAVKSVAFDTDGRTLASGGEDEPLKLWDVASGRLAKTIQGSDVSVESVVFSPDGRTLASAGYSMATKLWDVSSGLLLRTFPGTMTKVELVAFSPDGRVLAMGGRDHTITLWDVSRLR